MYSDALDPDINKAEWWHTKPVGAKVCAVCGCTKVRANVRHRKTVEGYEKIIKVCFGTDTSIEPIR